MLREPDTYTLPIMTVLLEAYGDTVFTRDALDLYAEIEEDFNVRIPVETENRIQAALLAMTTDLYYTDPLVTRSVALAFFEGDLGEMVSGVLEPVELDEVIWTTYELGLLREDEEKFSPDVQSFVDRLVNETADENEFSEEEAIPHYVRTLQDEKLKLAEQMRKLGVEDLSDLG